eukprot:CAMPEP_0178447766 /NCGR_PEP_ID=MMETSP0689_2-20121128/41594_1 /TAXON_ID=160604 /ORGANISM="Amphidinium massartii, Strain CS-259" /LENGTH=52 /DNA_ID=CAMNT_0020072843 /DNA_START=476 /DNA_END=634 /DNA_ORIENTATION=+
MNCMLSFCPAPVLTTGTVIAIGVEVTTGTVIATASGQSSPEAMLLGLPKTPM